MHCVYICHEDFRHHRTQWWAIWQRFQFRVYTIGSEYEVIVYFVLPATIAQP